MDLTPLIALVTVVLILFHTLENTDLMPFSTLEINDWTALSTLLITALIALIALVTTELIPFHMLENVFLIPSRIGLRNPTIAFHTMLIAVEISFNAVDTAFLINSHAAIIYSLQFSQINIQGSVIICTAADIISPISITPTVTTFFIVSHTVLTTSAIAVNTLVTVSFMASTFSDIAVLMFSQACLIESTKPLKNPLMASITLLKASLTDSHIFITALRKSSFVFQRVTSATTRPAIIAITATIGLADITANSPVIAVFTLSMISPILEATASEPRVVATPKIIGDNVMRISMKLCILPITSIALAAKSPRPSMNSVTTSIPFSKNAVKSIF